MTNGDILVSHDKLPYEVRKGSNVINPNPVETVKIPRVANDELLDKLNLVWDRDPEETQWELIEKLRNSLRAIVELHKPKVRIADCCKDTENPMDCSESYVSCEGCNRYPCLTIQAIEKELA